MSDWRSQLRALASLGPNLDFPLLVYCVQPPSGFAWPAELPRPSLELQEFYGLCDGGYLGGHNNLLSLAELLPENCRWWDLLADTARPLVIDPARHVVLGCDECGHPLVWDATTNLLDKFCFRDSDELTPTGHTLNEFLQTVFQPDFPDNMWQQALRQLNEHGGDPR